MPAPPVLVLSPAVALVQLPSIDPSQGANAAGDDVQAIELPEEAQATVEYPISMVVTSENQDAAQEFIDLVFSEDGQQALADAGFGPPE